MEKLMAMSILTTSIYIDNKKATVILNGTNRAPSSLFRQAYIKMIA
jgi:hypothetical protein